MKVAWLRRRFVLTLVTFLALLLASGIAIFLVKGQRISPKTKSVVGTGILSVTSKPDQASIYIDNHLTSATNANIALEPKIYQLKITKEGYIPWEKNVEIREGFVTDVKVVLFPAIPSIAPITFNGVAQVTLSSDGKKVAYIVPGNDKKSGVWVWNLTTDRPLLGRGQDRQQIMASMPGVDLSQATLRFSPDAEQLLVSLPQQHLLLETNKLNETPRDITAVLRPTITAWEQEEQVQKESKIQALRNPQLKQIASASATLKWSPDETKLLYSQNGKNNFKVADLQENKTYDLPDAFNYFWLNSSQHLIMLKVSEEKKGSNNDELKVGEVAIIEFDGSNKAVIYAGNINPNVAFALPDDSRLIIVSAFPTPTGNKPNLYGISLK